MDKKIIEIIRKTLFLKEMEITSDTAISDIVQDSMDLIELVAVFSDEYKIKVIPTELSKINKIKDIINYIKKNKQASNKSSLDSF